MLVQIFDLEGLWPINKNCRQHPLREFDQPCGSLVELCQEHALMKASGGIEGLPIFTFTFDIEALAMTALSI